MIELTITALPAAPLHALEIWSNPLAVASRFQRVFGAALPMMGSSITLPDTQLMRFEPAVWLVEGKVDRLTEILGGDGSLTAIGGGITRVRLSGSGWRSLLMEGGVFDAEASAFASGSTAATLIDHVNVRLHVESAASCMAYVPLSYSQDMLHFWTTAAQSLP